MHSEGVVARIGEIERTSRRFALLIAFAFAGSLCGALAPPSRAVEITSFPVPGLQSPGAITAGADGNIWFVCTCGRIGRITPTGTVTSFAAMTSDAGIFPGGIAAGADGNLWFTDWGSHSIGRISPNGQVTFFSNGVTGDLEGSSIVRGPDGDMWFTEVGRVGRITPAGVVTEFRPYHSGAGPADLAAGPDGNLWVTYPSVSSLGARIVRLTPSGAATPFVPSPPRITGDQPYAITAGPDRALWYVSANGRAVLRMSLSGSVREMTRPFTDPNLDPGEITRGPDGAIWFTERPESNSGSLKLGRVTPSGAVSEFLIDRRYAGGGALTSGPDGNLWLTMPDRILRVRPTPIEVRVSDTGAFTLPTTIACLSIKVGCSVSTVAVLRNRPQLRLGGLRFAMKGWTRSRGWTTQPLHSLLSSRGRRLLRQRRSIAVTIRTVVSTPGDVPPVVTRRFDATLNAA
jgi:streptogramin lyase